MNMADRFTAIVAPFAAIAGSLVSAFAPLAFPEHALLGFWLGIALFAVSCASLAWVLYRKEVVPVTNDKKNPIIGLDIKNESGGIGLDINSEGSSGQPSVGMENIITAPIGQDVIGTRIIQRGPGTGLRVVQRGPGVGFKTVLRVGLPKDGEK
ncbi:hypothetical protein [Xanthobacter flavus]|uniref:hypothetical protein n=1 Tax=Xanthobacter flavus TaxID=281 RepID=UPI00372628C6